MLIVQCLSKYNVHKISKIMRATGRAILTLIDDHVTSLAAATIADHCKASIRHKSIDFGDSTDVIEL